MEKEEWYFSIVGVSNVLTDSIDPTAYWRKLKQRLKSEGNETVTNCHGLEMTAADGKKRLTDIADTKQLLRIIQAIPSPKAEPFKLWLAQVGRELIEETIDLELTIERALETYLKKGYPREWINQRLQAIQARKELTDEWDARGVQKGIEYAVLTDEITQAWSGMSTRQYRSPSFFRISLTISIHAPRGGSDPKSCPLSMAALLFQSTLPVGGATFFPPHFIVFPRNFNPRSPWGERLPRFHPHSSNYRFQSTLPVGGATVEVFVYLLYSIFQSTLPVGGATPASINLDAY